MTRYTHSIATVSWIDKRVRLQLAAGPPFGGSLPVNDGSGPPDVLSRGFFRACQGFRFANFLEVGIEVDSGQIVAAGFTPDSRGYFSPSLGGEPSHAYQPKRTMTSTGTDRVFTQIVGARTLGQEEVGGIVGQGVGTLINPLGGPLGRDFGRRAARATTPFAPIWSELEIRFSPGGAATGRIRRFSIFPSLTYYEERSHTPDTLTATVARKPLPYGPQYYDAGQAAQTDWFQHGWDRPRGGTLGPTPGNPWGIVNDGTDREVA